MTLTLYNTLTRRKEPFQPIDPKNVRMYVCGPTVYDLAHIGNARPIIVFDVLFRLLRHLAAKGEWDGGKGETKVTYARNITDVDDKINARAVERYPDMPPTEAIRKLTEETTAQFHKDIAALGVLEPTVEPRATEHIAEMRALCEALVKNGNAYVAEDHVLFAVNSMADYGKLARRSLDEMEAGARVDVAPYKKGPMDFVLWKPSKPGEPAWPSPCGIATPGRPGWHIECSAMADRWLWQEPKLKGLLSEAGLKQPHVFDIHGGGIDLVFPHHENEVAQSRCAHGTDVMANVWMHNGFLQVEGEKMSKSLGNFVTIRELLETTSFGGHKWQGAVLRLAMLSTHYTQPIDWTLRRLVEAQAALAKFGHWAKMHESSSQNLYAPFVGALEDDLNTPGAIAELHGLVEKIRSGPVGAEQAQNIDMLVNSLALLGVTKFFTTYEQEAAEKRLASGTSRDEVDRLIAARLAARKAKNWAESDRIRDELSAMGIQLKDVKDPTTGEIKTEWEVKR